MRILLWLESLPIKFLLLELFISFGYLFDQNSAGKIYYSLVCIYMLLSFVIHVDLRTFG